MTDAVRSKEALPSSRMRRAGWLAPLAAALMAWLTFCPAADAQPAAGPLVKLTVAVVEIEDDPRYEPIKAAQHIVLKAPHRPWIGATVGVDDAVALSRITGTQIELRRITVDRGKVAEAIDRAREQDGISLFLLDLPSVEIRAAAQALKGKSALAFNVSESDDAVRREMCAAEVVHAMPSYAMRADALMQHLVSHKWRDVLLLEGPESEDAAFAAAVVRSVKKMGARLAAHTKFKLGNDPRDRDLNNPALLTAINRDYDVVIVADAGLDMARQLQYRTVRPRPVLGSTGLEAEAWHWTWDRNGGPQLNGRFLAKSGGLPMGSADWAAWIAVKMISEAVLRTASTDIAGLRRYIVTSGNGQGDGFDGAKSLAVSVRSWDQQVRQPMLLATPLAVVGTPPIDGFLHQSNRLDTLGDDAAESSCRLDQPKK